MTYTNILMLIYLIPLILLIFCIFRYESNKNIVSSHKIYYFIYAILICISAFSSEIGSDTIIYMEEYNVASMLNDLSVYDFLRFNRQPGWILLFSVCKTISTHYWVFKVVQSLFINGVICFFIKNNSYYIFTTTLLYYITLYFQLNFETMRESFAIVFFLNSYKYIISNQWIKYYICAFIALSFHISAVITLIIPMLKYFLPFTKKLSTLYYLFILLIFITPYIQVSSSELDFLMSDKISTNASFYLDENAASISLTFILMFTVKYYIYRKCLKSKINSRLILMLLCSISLTIFSRSIPILYRFDNYFVIPVIICLSASINNMIDVDNRILSTICIVIIILFLNYSDISSYWNINSSGEQQISYYVPYKWIF